jgi:hypothetical protein
LQALSFLWEGTMVVKLVSTNAVDVLLQQLEELKFIRVKSRRTLENGDQQVEYMKFDE